MSYLYNKDYFINYIANEEKRIEKFLSFLDRCVTEEQKSKCYMTLLNLYKNVIYCYCSLSDFSESFQKVVKAYLDCFSKVRNNLYPSEIIDGLAIEYLFSEGQDKLYESIIEELKANTDCNVYKYFVELIENEKINEDLNVNLRKFMNEIWYTSCEDFPWYDCHKLNNETYVGYFSFIASSIIKKYNLDKKDINFIV